MLSTEQLDELCNLATSASSQELGDTHRRRLQGLAVRLGDTFSGGALVPGAGRLAVRALGLLASAQAHVPFRDAQEAGIDDDQGSCWADVWEVDANDYGSCRAPATSECGLCDAHLLRLRWR